MANSTTNLDTIAQNQAFKEKTANGLFDAMSQSATYGRRESLCTGLTFAYFGGLVTLPSGVTATIANDNVTLTASTTNYIVVLKSSGAVSSSTTTTNWNSGNYWRLYSVVTGTATVTSYTDYRQPAEYLGANIRDVPVTKTTAFTLAANENEVICNGSASITVTLPAASGSPGRKVRIKTVAAFTVISDSSNVVPLAGGAAGTAILAATAGKWAEMVSDGTNWIIMAAA